MKGTGYLNCPFVNKHEFLTQRILFVIMPAFTREQTNKKKLKENLKATSHLKLTVHQLE
jgi:hypothetical protein